MCRVREPNGPHPKENAKTKKKIPKEQGYKPKNCPRPNISQQMTPRPRVRREAAQQDLTDGTTGDMF